MKTHYYRIIFRSEQNQVKINKLTNYPATVTGKKFPDYKRRVTISNEK